MKELSYSCTYKPAWGRTAYSSTRSYVSREERDANVAAMLKAGFYVKDQIELFRPQATFYLTPAGDQRADARFAPLANVVAADDVPANDRMQTLAVGLGAFLLAIICFCAMTQSGSGDTTVLAAGGVTLFSLLGACFVGCALYTPWSQASYAASQRPTQQAAAPRAQSRPPASPQTRRLHGGADYDPYRDALGGGR